MRILIDMMHAYYGIRPVKIKTEIQDPATGQTSETEQIVTFDFGSIDPMNLDLKVVETLRAQYPDRDENIWRAMAEQKLTAERERENQAQQQREQQLSAQRERIRQSVEQTRQMALQKDWEQYFIATGHRSVEEIPERVAAQLQSNASQIAALRQWGTQYESDQAQQAWSNSMTQQQYDDQKKLIEQQYQQGQIDYATAQAQLLEEVIQGEAERHAGNILRRDQKFDAGEAANSFLMGGTMGGLFGAAQAGMRLTRDLRDAGRGA